MSNVTPSIVIFGCLVIVVPCMSMVGNAVLGVSLLLVKNVAVVLWACMLNLYFWHHCRNLFKCGCNCVHVVCGDSDVEVKNVSSA